MNLTKTELEELRLEARNYLPGSEKAKDYLTKRKVTQEAIDCFEVGYLEKPFTFFNRKIIFPIKDLTGELVALQGRAITKSARKYYHTSFEKNKHLYGFYENFTKIQNQNRVVLVEGAFDVIACWQSDIPAVALLGTSFSLRQAMLLSVLTDNIFVWSDNDEAGIKSYQSVLGKTTSLGCNVQQIKHPVYNDASELQEVLGEKSLRDFVNAHKFSKN